MEVKTLKPMENCGIRRITRDFPPAHYLFRVESLSLLAKLGLENYESGAFEAAGHKWKLSLYPNGDKKSNGSGFISLYLVIDEVEKLPSNWEVNVSFKLFVFDQIRDKYLTIEGDDGSVKRFHWMKTKWGFAQLISLELFNDPSNGYLIDDCCLFGVEVFLIERNCKRECLSVIKKPDLEDNTITFKMKNFSKLDKDEYSSSLHPIGDLLWKLMVHPRGDERCKGEALSIFLWLVLPPKSKVFVKARLRVKDQINSNHKEEAVETWFSATSAGWGRLTFLDLEDLHDASKGFVVNDSLIAEAEITLIIQVKSLS